MVASLERPELALPLAQDLDDVLAAFSRRHPDEDGSVIEAAGALAQAAHGGQRRRSGEPYVSHPIAVAGIVAELGLDAVAVAAALAHDVVEDIEVTLEEVATATSPEVAGLVDGLTKIKRLPHASTEEANAATLRKLLIAVASDVRVLVVKLADRLHNMATLDALEEPKRQRIAKETLAVYAPLAHRLGIGDIKWRLEDMAFRALEPARYRELGAMVDARIGERAELLDAGISAVRTALGRSSIDAEVSGRVKHLWSMQETMMLKDKAFDDLADLVGVRVLVADVQACYGALGAIHSMPGATPLPGRFKDFIAAPKWNSYQSLHVAVVLTGGQQLEIQIRTFEMHRRAEVGVAAHWAYKAGRRPDASTRELAWFERLLESEAEGAGAGPFLAQLKADLADDEVYVFTPKGRVLSLPYGATPVDVAYAVHTDIGNAATGAKVNGALVPLRTVLSSGDTVEIITRAGRGGPSRDWLGFVRTARARSRIRGYFARARRADSIELGRDALAKALRVEGIALRHVLGSSELAATLEDLHVEDVEGLQLAIGEGRVAAVQVAGRLRRELAPATPAIVTTVAAGRPTPGSSGPSWREVHVEGLDDVLVRFARCCDPQPDVAIIGFVTVGRGVSVHRSDCANVASLAGPEGGQADRMIEVEWAGRRPLARLVSIEVSAFDRARLLRDVAGALSEAGVSIVASNTRTGTDRSVRQRFDFELADSYHLSEILAAVAEVDAVYDVHCLDPGGEGGAR